jgi:molybdenum cofactor cytidylyltransferase
MSIAGVVLAAGSSSRMGRPKPLLMAGDQTFLARILGSMRQAGISDLTVVVAPDAARVCEEARSHGVGVVVNPRPERGQLSSFQTGVGALSKSCSGAVVALVDHPFVDSATYRSVAASLEESEERLVVPTYGGRRGHPLGMGRVWFPELAAVPDGEGVRWLLHRNPAAVLEIPVGDPGVTLDIDTPDDAAWAKRRQQRETAGG